MSHHINIIRIIAVANALEYKRKSGFRWMSHYISIS